ncbi:MAG: metal ABC transporter ATP-binding protein [Eubacteriales bacterium]
MALIECKDVSLAYEGCNVVTRLTFSVCPGDFLCVIGENGSGKSTLIKALLGLIRPSEGKIVLGDGLRRSQIGYLPQQTGIQKDFPASVNEVVLSGTLNNHSFTPFYTKADRERAARNMEKLGITSIARKSYQDLSGGQQQRVLLARALCATSKMLLLDEPTAGLDPIVTAEMYDIITSLNRDDGITVIMVSHDVHESVHRASHILHMKATPLFFGKTEDYVTSDVGRAFLQKGCVHDDD